MRHASFCCRLPRNRPPDALRAARSLPHTSWPGALHMLRCTLGPRFKTGSEASTSPVHTIPAYHLDDAALQGRARGGRDGSGSGSRNGGNTRGGGHAQLGHRGLPVSPLSVLQEGEPKQQ